MTGPLCYNLGLSLTSSPTEQSMAQVHQDIQAITDRIAEHAEVTEKVTREIGKVIVGQEAIIQRLLAAHTALDSEWGGDSRLEVTDEHLEKLRGLGYVK